MSGVWQCVKANEQKDDKTVCLTEAHSHGQQGGDFLEKKKATNKHRTHMAEMDKGFTLGLETHETNDRF